MSNTDSWAKRSESHRYSQDDRTKQWKFEKEINAKVEAFIDDIKQNVLVLGQYNMNLEPWRMTAIVSFRKYGVKILEKKQENGMIEVSLMKQKLSRVNFG